MNCEKITYYIDKGYLTELNISEKIQIKLHSLICNCCKNYAPDTKVLNQIMTLLNKEDSTQNLSDTEKNELKEALKKLE